MFQAVPDTLVARLLECLRGKGCLLLYCTILRKKRKVQEILASLPGSSHKAYKGDICNYKEMQDAVDLIEKEMGEIFACIHTAGAKPQRKTLLNSSPQELEEAFLAHGIGSFIFFPCVRKYCKKRKRGVIIGITTTGVVFPEATRYLGGYIPAKYALQGILTMLKEELRESCVRVYSVAPGFMEGDEQRYSKSVC